MDINYYKKFEPFFGNWYITKELGSGSFGKVYEIQRSEMGTTYKAALKAITIPASEYECKAVMDSEGMSLEEASEYYKGVAEYFYKECVLMSKLKGNTNIVGYEDHQIVKHSDGIGWDIFIRMELLTPLRSYLQHVEITEQLVGNLAKDICNALILCEKKNIIHRDIKPENIFVNENGAFKLGDFGVARSLESVTSATTRVGTIDYSAPEVFGNKKYDLRVDIYSLGIVMYRLLNENRQPFMPLPPVVPTVDQKEEAKAKRMRGEKMIYPVRAKVLGNIILKACEFEADNRYQSAEELKSTLETINYDDEKTVIEIKTNDSTSYNAETATFVENFNEKNVDKLVEMTEEHSEKSLENSNNKKKTFISTKLTLCICVAAAISIVVLVSTLIQNIRTKMFAKNYQNALNAYYGNGVEQDYNKAFEGFEKSAKAGNKYAMNALGTLYYGGNGTEQNYDMAYEWYTKSAAEGNTNAMCNLGYMFINGAGVGIDLEESAKWYKDAADAGDYFAMYNLGTMYTLGVGTPMNTEKGVDLIIKAAENGIVEAASDIGERYCYGEGVYQNYEEALKYLEIAAETGDLKSYEILADMYYFGNGVTQDYDKALEYYKIIAETGDARANYAVGSIYYFGYGVQKDNHIAYEWFKKAYEAGYTDAGYAIGVMYYNGEGIEKDYKEAFNFFEFAADNGHNHSQYNLGVMYANGEGVVKNEEKAAEWYEKAAENGNVNAMQVMAERYESGNGVEANADKSKMWKEKYDEFSKDETKLVN